MGRIKTVTIGIIGAGRAAHLHLDALKYAGVCQIRIKWICALREEQLKAVCREYSCIEGYTLDPEQILSDPEVDVVDICSPPYTHIPYASAAIRSGKDVICEKPLSGYFGREGESEPAGFGIPRSQMYERTCTELLEFEKLVKDSGQKFLYAENFIFAPAIQKAAEIIRARGSRLLFMKGEESLRGSTSHVAGLWNKSGGGTLIRTGIHPLSAILWLKQVEAETRNKEIRPASVMAQTGRILAQLSEDELRHIDARPVDVEDLGVLLVTFSDETRGLVIAADTLLGGSRNYVDIYANNAAMRCNLTMNNAMECFLPDQEGMEHVEISEMTRIKTGWNNPFVGDEFLRGYIPEMKHFMQCLCNDQQPIIGVGLACEIIRVLYAGYLAASNGTVENLI